MDGLGGKFVRTFKSYDVHLLKPYSPGRLIKILQYCIVKNCPAINEHADVPHKALKNVFCTQILFSFSSDKDVEELTAGSDVFFV